MTVFDTIVTGFEAALELERELGVRVVECDRSLLVSPERALPKPPVEKAAVSRPVEVVAPEKADDSAYDFVFLHDRALSAAATQMMEKIIGAMKKTTATAPIITATPLPKAKIYVVLGSFALKKFFPALRASPGQWLKSENGEDVLISNSPEYILRFGVESEAVKKIKQDMWRSLKTVLQRLATR
jgi:hypothetical protein